MQKLTPLSFGLVALFSLSTAHAYQCKLDLKRNYGDVTVYMNNQGDTYATVDYDDLRYGTMEHVWDLKSCKKVSSGEKAKSSISSVLSKNGFRQIRSRGDLSPWLTHYYSLDDHNNQIVVKVEPVSSKDQQVLKELFAYARDKSSTLSSAAIAMFNSKYAKTAQFKSSVVDRYFQSQNWGRFATRIEKELLSSPASLKNTADAHFLTLREFKLYATNSKKNEFEIELASNNVKKLSKSPKIVMKASCQESALRNKRDRTVRGGWFGMGDEYAQVVADKTISCQVNGYSSADSLKASLTQTAKMLGLEPIIDLKNHTLGKQEELVMLSEENLSKRRRETRDSASSYGGVKQIGSPSYDKGGVAMYRIACNNGSGGGVSIWRNGNDFVHSGTAGNREYYKIHGVHSVGLVASELCK